MQRKSWAAVKSILTTGLLIFGLSGFSFSGGWQHLELSGLGGIELPNSFQASSFASQSMPGHTPLEWLALLPEPPSDKIDFLWPENPWFNFTEGRLYWPARLFLTVYAGSVPLENSNEYLNRIADILVLEKGGPLRGYIIKAVPIYADIVGV